MGSKYYYQVYPFFTKTLAFIERKAVETNNADTVYYTLKKFLELAFNRCHGNYQYCRHWLAWFKGKKTTVHLRELFQKVGCEYWTSLVHSNAIDLLDSYQKELIAK